ncbi:MAG: hypothetical protein AAF502_03445 [Bacteroidota bacterium]
MNFGVKLLLAVFLATCFFACEKSDLPEVDLPFTLVGEKMASSKYSKIVETSLKDDFGFDDFDDNFLGTWQVLEVITLNPLGQWIYLDYSLLDLEYSFFEDCRYYEQGEMLCRFESTHEDDPSGLFEVRIENGVQKLYLQSVLSNLTLDDSYWGDVFHWPDTELMVIYKPEAPFWIILERVFVE